MPNPPTPESIRSAAFEAATERKTCDYRCVGCKLVLRRYSEPTECPDCPGRTFALIDDFQPTPEVHPEYRRGIEVAAKVARDAAKEAAEIALEGGERARANESMEAMATRIAIQIERL